MALLCDPPYHLTSITKRFGKPGAAPAKGGPYRRTVAGFAGKRWDGGDIAFQPGTWAALAQHLEPGAFVMAFGGCRTYHRLATALEGAGLIIHSAIAWVQSQGFPKGTRLDLQLGEAPELAQAWAGHRYGLQALKPAVELIAVAQVPYAGRPVDCVAATGAGAFNIEAGRVPANVPYAVNSYPDGAKPFGGGAGHAYATREEAARWPANLALDEAGARALDAQAGEAHPGHRGKPCDHRGDPGPFGSDGPRPERGYDDRDGPSRYFFVARQIEENGPFRYCAKASRKERDAGLEAMPLRACGMSHGAQLAMARGEDYRAGQGIGLNRVQRVRNPHPTVKPLSLLRWLSGLLLPPELYAPRRLLVPFAGVGSEMAGAGLAGWEYVVGIEQEPEYVEIAQARLAHWLGGK